MRSWSMVVVALLAGCLPTESETPLSDTDTDTDSDTDTDTDLSPQEQVCERWNALESWEGDWTGSTSECDAGDVLDPGRQNALDAINFYRWLVDEPEATLDDTRNATAQECALMMDANGSLSHNPPSSWACYTADGAGAAAQSNIATTPGVAAVHLYMVDPGNETTLGHRRWILNPRTGPVGVGSTDAYSCLHVIGGSNTGDNSWTAFPPPGFMPMEAYSIGWSSYDATGWSIQSSSMDLSNGEVTVTEDGAEVDVAVATLAGGYGSSSAIKITPQGWAAQQDAVYRVVVGGLPNPIDYEFTLIGCE